MTTGNLGSDSNQPSKTTNQEDFSLHTLQYTYTGLLDDVMVRYSNEYLSEDFFNKMIAKNIFLEEEFILMMVIWLIIPVQEDT